MQVYTNLWGGESFLTSASLLAMASVGMFDNIQNNGQDVDVYCHCLDFAKESQDDENQKKMQNAYYKYHDIVFGTGERNSLAYDGQSIDSLVNMDHPTNPKLTGKYGQAELLSIGCTEKDMSLNIKEGIYGKPWVGEAYYADSDFSNLYSSAEGNIVVINCGGYKGGGTAATFINLENRFNISESNPNVTSFSRFNVIAGPSTQFSHFIRLPHPEIYTENRFKGEIDIFDSGELLEELENKTVTGANSGLHEENKNTLARQWGDIYNTSNDYRSLNPKYYMSRFIDRVRSDTTLANSVNFINIKANLKADRDSYNYDITSDEFAPNKQIHRLHITNLLNAVTIQEIALNSGSPNYKKGNIYTFCVPDDSKFTPEGIFRTEDTNKFYRFLIFSVIIVKYLYNCFYDIKKPGASILIDKWAIKKKPILGFGGGVVVDTKKTEGDLNHKFANTVKNQIAEFAVDYIKPVLESFMDINETCEDVQLFSRDNVPNSPFSEGIYGVVKELISRINIVNNEKTITPIESPQTIRDDTEKAVALIATGKNGKSKEFDKCYETITGSKGQGNNFIDSYQKNFQEFGTSGKNERTWNEQESQNVIQNAEEYCKNAISYTYSSIMQNNII